MSAESNSIFVVCSRWLARILLLASLACGTYVVSAGGFYGGAFYLTIPTTNAASRWAAETLLWSITMSAAGLLTAAVSWGLSSSRAEPAANRAGDLVVVFFCTAWIVLLLTILVLSLYLGSL